MGAGWQAVVAYVNIACYYLFGVPLGLVMGYKLNWGVKVRQPRDDVCSLPDTELKLTWLEHLFEFDNSEIFETKLRRCRVIFRGYG